MTLLITAVILLLLSGLLAPLANRGTGDGGRVAALLGLFGALLGLVGTVIAIGQREPLALELPWPSLGGLFALRCDALSAVFLLPLFLITGAGQLYGLGYRHPRATWINFFYPFLASGVAILLLANNGVVFLIGWEIMVLASFFLVFTERESDETFPAAFLYLAATHTGTLALFGAFALLGTPACFERLPAAGSLAAAGHTTLFLLALFGFSFKAGVMPLHIWLPRAHAAAPSQVSALMSGVMIKTGIYGLLRVVFMFREIPAWWGWLILALGVVSGVMGVVLAIAQHDLKRLLAYHSVENIGIIMIGIGAGLLGVSHNLPTLALLGLTGALLHVINHGLFKALLFFSGGAVVRATHTREMATYGGLLRAMPLTGLFFLGGAIAICGLPPLNGFVSEWLIYLGLFRGALPEAGLPGLLPAVAGLAAIGGLALLCFTKVFGLCFLGGVKPEHHQVREAPVAMLAAMAILLAACFSIGLAPLAVLPLLSKAVASLGLAANGAELAVLAPAGSLSLAALGLLVLVALLVALVHRRQRQPFPRATTWGCGYAQPLPRARYTVSSYAEILTDLCHWALRTRTEEEKPVGIFPARATFATHAPDLVLDRVILPLTAAAGPLATRVRHVVQHGVLGLYLLYYALVLCVLLTYAVMFG
jgi:hydrogenase-4 component B